MLAKSGWAASAGGSGAINGRTQLLATKVVLRDFRHLINSTRLLQFSAPVHYRSLPKKVLPMY
jgi:hypothetical protein